VTKGVLEGIDGFTFGCDPEMFVTDPEGTVVPASEAGVPGTKDSPHKVKNGAVQVDGMAAEINIDPAETWDEWNGNIVAVVKQLKAMLPTGFGLKVEPSVCFSQSVFDAAPETAKQMGCDPDYNAWTGEINPIPESDDPYLRCAGGHIHVGWTTDMPLSDEIHVNNCRDLVKQLDWYIGAPLVRKDPDLTRRKLYGKAGAYRPKSYGVEYRVPSNIWIASKVNRLFVWNRLQRAINQMQRSELSKRAEDWNEDLRELINTGNTEVQQRLEANFYAPLIAM